MRQRAAPVFATWVRRAAGGRDRESYTCSAVRASLHLRMGRTIAIVLENKEELKQELKTTHLWE